MQYSINDYILSLKNLGLKKGDNIFIHSNIAFFGPVDIHWDFLQPGYNEHNIKDFFLEPIFDLIGENGTIVVPTFTYSFTNNLAFDIENQIYLQDKLLKMVEMSINYQKTEQQARLVLSHVVYKKNLLI